MTSVRPYKLTQTTAIDINLVTSIDLIEHPNKAGKYQIIIGMYYSEPFVLDFDNKLAATTRFTELFKAWHDSETVTTEDLAKIKKAVDRLAEKVDTLNQLSHAHTYSGTLISTRTESSDRPVQIADYGAVEPAPTMEYVFNVNDNPVLASNIKQITTTYDSRDFIIEVDNDTRFPASTLEFAIQLCNYLSCKGKVVHVDISNSAKELMKKLMTEE